MFAILSVNGYNSSLSRIELLLCLLTWAFWVLLNIAEISQIGQGVASSLRGFFSTAVVSRKLLSFFFREITYVKFQSTSTPFAPAPIASAIEQLAFPTEFVIRALPQLAQILPMTCLSEFFFTYLNLIHLCKPPSIQDVIQRAGRVGCYRALGHDPLPPFLPRLPYQPRLLRRRGQQN